MKYLFLLTTIMFTISCVSEKIIEHLNPKTPTSNGSRDIFIDHDNSSGLLAEQYVQSAETLISPNGFMYAHQILEDAVTLDPTNFKAQFYLMSLKPLMLYQGFYTRIQPLLNQLSPLRSESIHARFRNLPPSSFKNFLFAPSNKPLTSEQDLQKFALELDHALEKWRTFLKAEKSRITTVKHHILYDFDKYLKTCHVTQLSPRSFQVASCAHSAFTSSQVDAGDMEALQQIVAGLQLLLKVGISYRLDGALAALKKIDDIDSRQPGAKQHKKNILQSTAHLGSLNNNHQMEFLREFGADFVSALKWADIYENYLCPNGQPRDNHLLSESGCLNRVAHRRQPRQELLLDEIINALELTLIHQPVSIYYRVRQHRLQDITPIINDDGPSKDVIFQGEKWTDFSSFFFRPNTDLKMLLPTYNVCNQIVSFSDPSLGGLFPDRDATDLFVNPLNSCTLD